MKKSITLTWAAGAAILLGVGGIKTTEAAEQRGNTHQDGVTTVQYGYRGGYYGYPGYRHQTYRYGDGHSGHYDWHDTSHYDWHPGSFYRHRNHYHYRPGHYDYHDDGHWDYHGRHGRHRH